MIRKFKQIIDLRKKDYQIVPFQRSSLGKKILRKLGRLADKTNQVIDNLAIGLDNVINSIQPKLAIATIILSCIIIVIFAEPVTSALSRTGLDLIESLIVRPVVSGIPL